MSLFKLRIRRRAEVDVTRAAQWHEGKRPGLGAEFLDDFTATYSQILENPLIHPIASKNYRVRKCLFQRFRYKILFAVEDEDVVIHAVIHGHRDESAWKSRLS